MGCVGRENAEDGVIRRQMIGCVHSQVEQQKQIISIIR